MAGFCDGVPPLGKDDFAGHVARIQGSLRRRNIGALVVEPGPTMFYLSGVRWSPSERAFLLVVPDEGSPWWVCPAFEAGRAAERAGRQADLRLWQEHEDPFALVAKGLGKKSVAVDPGFRAFMGERLKTAVGRELDSGRQLVRDARVVKGPRELALLERANLATKAALAAVHQHTQVGMRESQLRRLIVEAQRAAGLSRVWALVLFGPNAAFPHGTGKERTLAKGDFVLVDTGGQLHGYCSDITRTWPVGTVPSAARKAFDTVLTAQRKAFESIEPGIPCSQVDAAARSTIEKAGFGPGYEVFTHRLGHGIGLMGHEDPYLVRGNDLVLKPGMTMSNEPGIYLPDEFGVRIEDIFVVTENSYRVFGPRVPSFDMPVPPVESMGSATSSH
ncbi:MAG: Xaa-Pro peptidase family protein [Myxococcota bacterium]